MFERRYRDTGICYSLTSASMWILLLGLTSGLLASSWAFNVEDVTLRSCSYLGVFHIQGNDRYTLTFNDAKQLCEVLDATLANLEQVTAAHGKGMETCRNGWTSDGNVTILRHGSTPQCAGNQTGVIILPNPDQENDAYCYDQTDQSEKNCTLEIKQKSLLDDSELPMTTDLNYTDLPTELPTMDVDVDIHSTVMAETWKTNVTEQTDLIPTSSHDEYNASEEDQDLLIQTPSMTPTPEQDSVTDSIITVMSTLESAGSGMGETALTSTIEPNREDTDIDQDIEDTSEPPTALATEETPLDPNLSLHPRGRMGPGKVSPTEETGSGKDWLIILLVVVTIIAIIIVAALVVTRNRWCGRSQTLMITSKSSKEGNGTAASAASPEDQEREQEMVTLMNKEKIQENGNTEEFTVITLEESPEKNEQA